MNRIKSAAPLVTKAAARAVAARGIMNNPYFRALSGGAMTLPDFRRTQEQFFYAVTFFPRPMATLLARIPDPKARLDILHNLVEEHGEFKERAFHHNTFQTFLKSIGGSVKPSLPLWPEVRAFNSVLTTACTFDEVEVGIACMGAIEYSFARISAVIGKAVVARGWVEERRLAHYKLHAEIDERHSEEFFAIVERAWKKPSRRYFIEQGLSLGLYAFDRLYRDLRETSLKRKL